MDVEGVSLNGNVCVPRARVQVGSDLGNAYSPHPDVFWVGARVRYYSSGTLRCELSDAPPKQVNPFFSQSADSSITQLILTGGEILTRLSGGNQTIPSLSLHRTFTVSARPDSKSPTAPPPSTISSLLTGYPIREFSQEYRFRFEEMRIVEGAAVFDIVFEIPRFRMVSLELRVENDFLEGEFEYIKPYIAKRLGRLTLNVSAIIQTQGPEVVGVNAISELVDRITPELIERVRHWQIRRALSTGGGEKELVTVDDLFREEVFEKSNIKPTDVQFVKDILAIKKPKHADQTLYLSALHAHAVMRLRWVKQQGAFLFLLRGKLDSFLVLETLNSKEATYLWRLHVTGSQLSEDRALLDQLLEDARLYKSGEDYKKLLDFTVRLRNFAPFNAMLLQVQKPGLSYAASASEWRNRFGRTIKEGGRPLLILWPFGPVALVYDVMDTEGDSLPEDVNPFVAKGVVTSEQMNRFYALLQKKQIYVLMIDTGDNSAGRIRTVESPSKECKGRYKMHINRNHPVATQFTTLAHELGHLHLGHLGANKRLKIPERRELSHRQVELEAESVAYLVCKRNGVDPKSQTYLSSYVKQKMDSNDLDVYQIMRAAGQIETLLELTAHTKFAMAGS